MRWSSPTRLVALVTVLVWIAAGQKAYELYQNGQRSWLEVRSVPAGAQVWLDGSLTGTTPLRVLRPAGELEVEVRKDGCAPARRRVRVAELKTTLAAFDLEPLTATLDLNVKGPKKYQVTASPQGRSWSDPERLSLEPGPYRFLFEAPGYRSVSRVIRLEPGSTHSLSVAMEEAEEPPPEPPPVAAPPVAAPAPARPAAVPYSRPAPPMRPAPAWRPPAPSTWSPPRSPRPVFTPMAPPPGEALFTPIP